MTRAEFAAAIKEKYVTNGTGDIGKRFEVYDALFHTGAKIIEHIGSHDHPCISVSGGSDSDCVVHLLCTYFPEYVEKCRFVFVNTGLEYEATKRHLCDLEKRYGIIIDRIRGRSVVSVVREYGVPILSKYKSEMIRKHMNGNEFAWGYIFGDKVKTNHSMMFTDAQKTLVQYLVDNKIKVSALCCTYSKKKPLKHFQKEFDIDLSITGERQAEGGNALLHINPAFKNTKTIFRDICRCGGGVMKLKQHSKKRNRFDSAIAMRFMG